LERLRQLLCRHEYRPVERIEDRLDAGGDPRLEVFELRCAKCGKRRFLAHADPAPVGQGDLRRGSVRRERPA
jgi:hypothetical protein